MKNGTCPKCGVTKVLQNVPVQANVISSYGSGILMITLIEPPDEHKMFQSVHTENFTFRAWICATCGYTEFYIREGERFNEACKKDWYAEST